MRYAMRIKNAYIRSGDPADTAIGSENTSIVRRPPGSAPKPGIAPALPGAAVNPSCETSGAQFEAGRSGIAPSPKAPGAIQARGTRAADKVPITRPDETPTPNAAQASYRECSRLGRR